MMIDYENRPIAYRTGEVRCPGGIDDCDDLGLCDLLGCRRKAHASGVAWNVRADAIIRDVKVGDR